MAAQATPPHPTYWRISPTGEIGIALGYEENFVQVQLFDGRVELWSPHSLFPAIHAQEIAIIKNTFGSHAAEEWQRLIKSPRRERKNGKETLESES